MRMETFPEYLHGRWLLVSADDESWERVREDFDFILELGATDEIRNVVRPKGPMGRALLGDSIFVDEHRYRIEEGLLVERFGDCEALSRVVSNPGCDELVLERVRVRFCGVSWDESDLGRARVVLRRIRG